ncbi:MAG: bifunctional adenosylcobinamide kinase/adenosylcobinamide-phosphate guanylyltransferase [Clostridiales Family XIII bacterium]|jgi:adenosylcobinamide kinase/adenosylcobinamide-phosphate guanylyltransferase|nr:bifunctional adenosylcobinamide kinase/adenosylcobinamide-phosphate guanylyltransferase [Clostridiales Family XIII bacterium]
MSEIILVTGGARSGKSLYAEALATNPTLYIATAQITDEEMEDRIRRHRERRPEGWITLESHRDFIMPDGDYETILLDDLGNLLMGVLFDEIPDADTCALSEFDRVEALVIDEIKTLAAFARAGGKRLILVTNEIGLGLVPAYRLGRYYRDILGRANRCAAELADRVVFLVSGIPLNLKAPPERP